MVVRGVNFREERVEGKHTVKLLRREICLSFPRTIFLICWALLARPWNTVVVKIS